MRGTPYFEAPLLSTLKRDMGVCQVRKNRMETRHRTSCRLPGKRVPGASQRSRILKLRITVGGACAIVYGVSPEKPTVAEPLKNKATNVGAITKGRNLKKNTNQTSDDIEIREGSTVFWKRKEGTPAGWISFRESLRVVWEGSNLLSLRKRHRSSTTRQSRKRVGENRPSRAPIVGSEVCRPQRHQLC